MRILGRPARNCARTLAMLPQHVLAIGRCFRVFERPAAVLWAYVTRSRPAGGFVRLRTGLTITLSSDPADIVTVFLVFAREDYGRIEPGSAVVDIGANIGVFSLYAAACGARFVLAYEPGAESFDVLTRNIRQNGLEAVVTARRLAVASGDRSIVRFPRRSSVMNTMMAGGAIGEYDEVPATTLDAIVEPLEHVDLVKLDCEGAEYEILLTAGDPAFRKIRTIKLEYHHGRQQEIVDRLRRHGLEPTYLTADNEIGGVIWFDRRQAA
jgi:FkbM family methyltransferase